MRKQPSDTLDAFQGPDDFSSRSVSGRLDWLGYLTHSVSELEYQRMTQLLREQPELETDLAAARWQLSRLGRAKQATEQTPAPLGLARRTILRIAAFARRTVNPPRMSPVRGPFGFGDSGHWRFIDVAVTACTLAIVLTIAIPAIYEAKQNAFWLNCQNRLRQWGHSQEITHATYPQSDHSPLASSVQPMDSGIPMDSVLVTPDWTQVSPEWQEGMDYRRQNREQGSWTPFIPQETEAISVPLDNSPASIVFPTQPLFSMKTEQPNTSSEAEAAPVARSMFDELFRENPPSQAANAVPAENTADLGLAENRIAPSSGGYTPASPWAGYNTSGPYQVFHDGHVGPAISPLTTVSPVTTTEPDGPSSKTSPPLSSYPE
ncbi:MAG: hypothetical protein PHE53_03865 [Thermoguttaceae bacterium]|nr:hypothetical protein [Thermoguttaceae bacterium]